MKRKKHLGMLFCHQKKNIVLLSGLTVLRSFANVTLAILMRYVIDTALSKNENFAYWAIALVADLLLMILLYCIQSWYTGSASDHFVAKLQKRLLSTAVYSTDLQLQHYHSGELLSRGMEDAKTLCKGVMENLPSLIGQITSLVAAFAAVVWINLPVALAMAVMAVVMGSAAVLLRPMLKRKQNMVRQAEEQVTSDMQETLQQLELVQSLEIQRPILNGFGRRLQKSLEAKFKHRLLVVTGNTVISAMSNLCTGVFLLWGAGQIMLGTMSYGALTAILQLLSQFRGPILSLSGLWTQLATVEVAAERLQTLLIPEEDVAPFDGKGIAVKAVVFEKVTFCYPDETVPVVENFSARFPLGQWSCLTGISGKGKTTLFKLILGLYTPQQGRVYLQTDRGEFPCSIQTRQLFAYVPQDYALFSGTISGNLRLVAPEADTEQLRAALEIADAAFVWDLTAGLETSLRENNAGLSKGQIQRLAIARAVLMDRPVFLLDECTSALDSQTEEKVLTNLKNLGKQAILVTHRPEMLTHTEDVAFVVMEE